MPLPPPPPPAPPPPPPPMAMAASAPPAKTKDRAALLGDIQKGRALRKVETNDRSAPAIDSRSAGSSAQHTATARPGPPSSGKFSAPAAPSAPLSFADELNRRLGGGGRGVGRNIPDGSGHATNAGTSPVISASAAATNGVSRPLPPPPPQSAPSFPAKPVQSHATKPGATSVKPMAPQPSRAGPLNNGAARNIARGSDNAEDNDGRTKGPSVKEQMRLFANANLAQAPAAPPQAVRQRVSQETAWNGSCQDDGTYAAKAAPPPPPSKPPSRPPQKDTRFHTLNPARMKQQQGPNAANIPRSGSHESLPAAGDSFHPPAPPPKASTARSPGSASRPAPPPPGRPPPPPERPQVAPPPPPPPAPPQKTMNGRQNVSSPRNNDTLIRSPCVENSPAPPPRRESLMSERDLERRFSFTPLDKLPPPEEFRDKPKIYSRAPQSQQQRSRAPEPPTHR